MKNDQFIMHFRDFDSKIIGTVCAFAPRGATEVTIGVSVVNQKHDQGSKKFGVALASTRASAPSAIRVPVKATTHDALRMAIWYALQMALTIPQSELSEPYTQANLLARKIFSEF